MNALLSLPATILFWGAPAIQEPLPEPWATVGRIIGKPGVLQADGSFRINVPRTDVQVRTSLGLPVPADLGLTTYAAFAGDSERATVAGDTCMLAHEIDGAIDALREGGIEVVALHNHMVGESPKLYFLHFQGVGKPEALARAVRKAFDVLGTPQPQIPVPIGSKPILDADSLAAILKRPAQKLASGALRFATPRSDLELTLDGAPVVPGQGPGSWVVLSPCPCGLTMAMGDTCCLRSELQGVIDALRKAQVRITGIHNHFMGLNRELMFVHYEIEANAPDIARAVRACWDVLGR